VIRSPLSTTRSVVGSASRIASITLTDSRSCWGPQTSHASVDHCQLLSLRLDRGAAEDILSPKWRSSKIEIWKVPSDWNLRASNEPLGVSLGKGCRRARARRARTAANNMVRPRRLDAVQPGYTRFRASRRPGRPPSFVYPSILFQAVY